MTVVEGDAVLKDLSAGGYDVLLHDLELRSSGDGEPLRLMRGSRADAEAVLISHGSAGGEESSLAPGAIEAHGFLTRPLPPTDVHRSGDPMEAADAQTPVRSSFGAGRIVGDSPALIEVLSRLERIAPSNAAVLLQGETGTGKNALALALHEASRRRDHPFVVVNCSAFQDQLLESELFGHEKGAFTGAQVAKPGLFEIADGGTLFLDEVAEMSAAMQAKLLHVLDTGEMRRVGGTRTRSVDVRILSASNKDLVAAAKNGQFREDLLFRLKVITVTVPPLRERREDIPALVELFLHRFRGDASKPKTISPVAMRYLVDYDWPGNIRELAHVLEGLVLLSAGEIIGTSDLPPSLRARTVTSELTETGAPLPMIEIERSHIARALQYTEGKKVTAARLLGIDVKTLKHKMRIYGLETPIP